MSLLRAAALLVAAMFTTAALAREALPGNADLAMAAALQ